jgi:2-isopropylmalate synthase
VLFDAEHFFDGYKHNPEFALRTLEAAASQGCLARRALRHDGGALPHEVEHIVREVVTYLGGEVRVAVHLHDDGGTGVANAIAGVLGGATQVQGTINGYGERTGNCNLTAIIPNLVVEDGDRDDPRRSHAAAHTGCASRRRAREHAAQPAGRIRRHSAFAHKAGCT